MQQSIRNAVIPFYWNHFEQRVYIFPSLNGHQNIIAVFAAIECLHAVKVKIDNMNLTVILPNLIPQLIHIMAPASVHKHQVFTIQILNHQPISFCQFVMNGDVYKRQQLRVTEYLQLQMYLRLMKTAVLYLSKMQISCRFHRFTATAANAVSCSTTRFLLPQAEMQPTCFCTVMQAPENPQP